MLWVESVNLWGEEGEHSNMGKVKLQGTRFLHTDELTFLDDSMVVCTLEAFEDGPLKGFSVDRFVSRYYLFIGISRSDGVLCGRPASLVTSASELVKTFVKLARAAPGGVSVSGSERCAQRFASRERTILYYLYRTNRQ
ncbi:unnamed protein product [Fraxinus pennsylvanica]|uniref:Uncharacterized protein n=1 Tax=Fraxinus pennsylvanica TaxID=56036 RepID=A0AAD1ZRA7_9LAMI|nr:unnamed protein product [Fraxinus pennsylvanica]